MPVYVLFFYGAIKSLNMTIASGAPGIGMIMDSAALFERVGKDPGKFRSVIGLDSNLFQKGPHPLTSP